MKVSIIIPVYNEAKVIGNCLSSLSKQTIKSEIVVVDDGSTDGTLSVITGQKSNVILLKQPHMGPGAARNLGANNASGDILVFVDADMEFAPNFIERLIKPINNEIIGTYSTNEFLLNKDNPIARYWNRNFGRSSDKMEPRGYARQAKGLYRKLKNILEIFEGKKAQENKNKVFRAILKKEFLSVNGFNSKIGYTDDWSLAEKLNKFPIAVDDAIYFHRSPESYAEVWRQARWFGKNEFLTKNIIRKLFNLFRYNPIVSLLYISDFGYFKFKLVFNTAVFISVLLSFFSEKKFK